MLRAADRPGDLGWVVERHGTLYAAEYGWGQRFEGVVADVVASFAAAGDGARSAAWIAEVGGRRAGCVCCTAGSAAGTAKLRLLLVEPWARGSGVGRALVERCISFAQSAGYSRMELWTTADLEAAARLYEAFGFRVVREEQEAPFGTEVLSRFMELELG